MNNPTSSAVRRTIRQFTDYSHDLLSANMDTFENHLNIFAHFCESDAVFSVIHQQLMNNPDVNLREWISDAMSKKTGWVGGAPLQFPVNADERVSLMYQLLIAIQHKQISFHDFLINFFTVGTSKINHFIRAFQDGLLKPLFRDLFYKLEAVEERLPQQANTEVSPVTLHILHNSGNIINQIAQGNNITQNTSQQIQNPEIQRLFSQIVEIVRTSNITREQRRESEEILVSVEEELKKPSPKKSLVQALLNGLPVAASILEITAAILSLL